MATRPIINEQFWAMHRQMGLSKTGVQGELASMIANKCNLDNLAGTWGSLPEDIRDALIDYFKTKAHTDVPHLQLGFVDPQHIVPFREKCLSLMNLAQLSLPRCSAPQGG